MAIQCTCSAKVRKSLLIMPYSHAVHADDNSIMFLASNKKYLRPSIHAHPWAYSRGVVSLDQSHDRLCCMLLRAQMDLSACIRRPENQL